MRCWTGPAVEAEAIRIEADLAEADDRPGLWLRLAERALAQIPEPEPSALAHRGFRARLTAQRPPTTWSGHAQFDRREGGPPVAAQRSRY